jgi:hypothetical protein
MYLAALAPQNRALSTYFIAILEGVGGGGACYKCLSKSSSQTSEQKPTVITKAKISTNIKPRG